ncbi:YbaB/EbfC family nucleoid-associated protein [Bailinhaonella thermotolerans]|uniref:YbaB/EbfC family DNA-binding protein n=1 Tax=Bailinhaonella thermotolerans TaxID=1070861 RepID=A0A3A4AVX8_9ACTN|nr:YbaB/EbfC family nucleoid-associated protein [Bailinhaonella thermotolerans]RJL30033.1 hypothetical protein D5H75_24145 [Bailinhaonella thermotolerans]
MTEEEELWARLDAMARAARDFEERVGEWGASEFTGTADEGRIVATVNAMGVLLRLDVHVLSKRRLDGVRLGDAVVEAVNAAEAAADEARRAMTHAFRPGGTSLGELLGEPEPDRYA